MGNIVVILSAASITLSIAIPITAVSLFSITDGSSIYGTRR
jgi:hypothetical protein